MGLFSEEFVVGYRILLPEVTNIGTGVPSINVLEFLF